jgi:hypothetical protein
MAAIKGQLALDQGRTPQIPALDQAISDVVTGIEIPPISTNG